MPFDQSLDWILNRETSKEISLEGNALATGGGYGVEHLTTQVLVPPAIGPPEIGCTESASEPDLAYILVETLIFKIERVAFAFRAWTLLKRRPKRVQEAGTHTVRGNLGKNHEHTIPKRTPTQSSRLPRMRKPQPNRRLRPRRNHLPRLRLSSVPESDESRTRMASFH